MKGGEAEELPVALRAVSGFPRRRLAAEEREHLATLEERFKQLLDEDSSLESYPTFLFFKGAADGLFESGTEKLAKVVDDREALMLGIRCERGSHRFFKRYGEQFEDSEGKRIFLDFAVFWCNLLYFCKQFGVFCTYFDV